MRSYKVDLDQTHDLYREYMGQVRHFLFNVCPQASKNQLNYANYRAKAGEYTVSTTT